LDIHIAKIDLSAHHQCLISHLVGEK